ncbi:hypothetical protein [endosymbiont 'TC1' of Trimyema compressum]|uniref:hypothetical protein n=1 Tax=endosymbiont 'TC1' of Trimyema compressum TaxID=243899 RepID=UPI00155E74D1|nr:hypothetical protein [endosymbiont 'TC1' of Trimyema compressum]
MGIIGVLGCMMLILAGLGMKNSMSYTINGTYSDFYQYENKILLNEGPRSSLEIEDPYREKIEEGTLEIKNKDESKILKYTVEEQSQYLLLKDVKGNALELPSDGFVISDEIASKLNLKVGGIHWTMQS